MSLRTIRVGTGQGELSTLGQVRDALRDLRPKRTAPAAEWVAYHRQAASVYELIAEVDTHHHYEALNYWASREREKATEIARTGVVPSAAVDFSC